MSKVQFEIKAVANLHSDPVLEFEIKGLTIEQGEIVNRVFNAMFDQRFIARCIDPLNSGSKTFESDFKTGDEAKMFFGALQELDIEFNSTTQIRESITKETKKMNEIQGSLGRK